MAYRGGVESVPIAWKDDACDFDVICPTVERRAHAKPCRRGSAVAASVPGVLEFDGERGTASFPVEGEPTLRKELDAWR